MIQEGIYLDLSLEDYHQDINSISRSGIVEFKRSPHNYWAKYLNPNKPPKEKDSPSLIMGKAFHCYVLENDKFASYYDVLPSPVLLKDVGRIEYEIYKAEVERIKNSFKTVLNASDYIKIIEMSESIRKRERALDLLYGGLNESSYFCVDPDSGLMIKSRPDVLHENIYVDLKTCSDASPEAFQRSMALNGNHIQAAMVVDSINKLFGVKLEACINVCIETSYPYSIGIYFIDEEAIDYGRDEYKRTLLELKIAKDYNEYHDFSVKKLGLPRWYF